MEFIKEAFLDKDHSLAHLIDGAIAGFASALMIQPLQVIKTAMMITPPSPPSVVDSSPSVKP